MFLVSFRKLTVLPELFFLSYHIWNARMSEHELGTARANYKIFYNMLRYGYLTAILISFALTHSDLLVHLTIFLQLLTQSISFFCTYKYVSIFH